MPELDLNKLQQYKDEILKAEIGALLFNLGKTHAGISNWKDYFPTVNSLFSSYKDYYTQNHFENELVNTDIKLKNFVFKEKVKLPDSSDLYWAEFFKGNASNEDIIQKIFFRGCENINSGIDKGSPQDENQLDKLWISNAFGSLIIEVNDENDFDNSRLSFFREFHRFLEDNNYYNSPDWEKIRNWVFEHIEPWYSRLLSDSRFPVNDVTLFDQAYMTASLFKAVLASLYLHSSNFQIFLYNPQSIKWSILGIQYDKLGLAEKGLKVASIKWYRDAIKEVDEAIKNLFEIRYPIGNEVYRDETGIYFVVGENVKRTDKEGDFYRLNALKYEIYKIFSDKFNGEVYPAIFLTEPSRGLMNLGHLVEKAKDNFLKTEYPIDFKNKIEHDSYPNGICEICKVRLAHKSNNEHSICNVCKERQQGRIEKWLDNLNGETIWVDELQDKNGRIALITLKFELKKWLNGDMVNSLVVRNEDFNNYINNIKKILYTLKNFHNMNQLTNIWKTISNDIVSFLELFDKKGIKKPYEDTLKKKILKKIGTQPIDNLNEKEKGLRNLLWRTLTVCLELLEVTQNNWVDFVQNNFYANLNFDPNNQRIRNQNVFNNNDFIEFFQATFSIGFTVFQIYNLLLERSIGSKWEEFIKNNLSDKTAIQFENRKIEWNKLNNQDIEFLAFLILQFLLRKNPSPARLRRIWESTKEFLKELESKIIELAEIKQERCKRLYWENVQIDDGEYEYGNLLFWAYNKTVYLISSIEKIGDKQEFNLKRYGERDSEKVATLKRDEAKEIDYKPYFTILSPTPVSWQFIIPAKNFPALIKSVQDEYLKSFKWVYGKLPLHIGVVVQNYKKPLYVAIKALRKMRRDNVNWHDLGIEITGKELKTRQCVAFNYQENPEQNSKCNAFYSLFEKTSLQGKYEFYLYQDKDKVWLDTSHNSSDTDKFKIYPNTFDFEFLDTNTRRNDIFYTSGKRFVKVKRNRPYDLYKWQYYEKFVEYFFSDKKSSSKLQKLVSIIHTKLEDWKNQDEFLKILMKSSFINTLELKSKMQQDEFAGVLGLNSFEELKNLNTNQFKSKLLMILDMFDFWHTLLKWEA